MQNVECEASETERVVLVQVLTSYEILCEMGSKALREVDSDRPEEWADELGAFLRFRSQR
jgi:hypothetical protein